MHKCKSCGASKISRNACAYCGNPIEARFIKYIDVSGMSPSEAQQLVKAYAKHLSGALIQPTTNPDLIRRDILWTATEGQVMHV